MGLSLFISSVAASWWQPGSYRRITGDWISQHTVGATLLPFELVVLGVPRPRGAKAHQLGCDVGETPLQTPWTLLPHVAVGKQQARQGGNTYHFSQRLSFVLFISFFLAKTHLKPNKEGKKTIRQNPASRLTGTGLLCAKVIKFGNT